MPTSYTSLLGLALPVQGELTGTWGDTVNDYITKYVDASVAGTQTISGSQTAVTLSTTTGSTLSQAGSGATGSSQYMIINCTGNPAGLLTITAPSTSKVYLVLNNTSTAQSVKIVGAGPTTGVTVATAQAALVAWNGSDFELVATTDASKLTGVLNVANGGTGNSTIPARSVFVANALDTLTTLTPTAGQSIRINAGNTAWEAYTPSTGTGDAVLANNNAFTGANTFYNTTGQTFGTGTSTQDGIILAGRAGGSSSYRVTMQPGTLTASRTATFPDETFTVGFRNIPAVADKTSAYVLAVGDVGKVVGVGTGGSIEIPNSTFAAGDAVLIFNNTSAGITITCTITTAYIAGTDADKATVTLATRGVANILFISGTVCVITGNVS